jgi:hypothetical protein
MAKGIQDGYALDGQCIHCLTTEYFADIVLPSDSHKVDEYQS